MNYFSVGITLLTLGLAAPGAVAQSDPGSSEPLRSAPLINLDDAALLNRGQLSGHIDFRAFGGEEDLLYTSLGVHLGLGHNLEAAVRGSFANRKTLPLPTGSAIRHGGSDVELLARYRFLGGDPASSKPTVTGLVGVGLPSTPDRGSASLTLGLSASAALKHGAVLTLNPRAIFLSNNTLFGVGFGAHVHIARGVSLLGDYTPLLSGGNTRSTTDGALRSRDIYGAAIRLSSPDERISLDFGYTNGTGATTGFALTPGLGGSGAFYFAFTARR